MGFIRLLIAILAFFLPAAESKFIDLWWFQKINLSSNRLKNDNNRYLYPNPSSQDISSAFTCFTLVKKGEAWGIDSDINTLISDLTEYSVAYSVKFSSTLSDNIFQFGQSSGPHYVFSSTANGIIDGKFYKDATTPADSANDFHFTVPLSNCYTDKFFWIAFNWKQDANPAVTLNILTTGLGKSTYTSVAGSTSPFQLPYGYILLGKSVYAEFYTVHITKSAYFTGADYITLYGTDKNDASNNVNSKTCTYDCIDDVCDQDGDCISSANLCQCTSSTLCDSCIEPSRSASYYCETCKSGYSFKKHHCCSTSLTNCLDCSPSSGTDCTLCAADYFLYDNGSGTHSCISCANSCTNCNPSPQCFICATAITQDGNTCRVDSIGFQISFISPNIIELDFASALTADLTKNSISAKTVSALLHLFQQLDGHLMPA